MLDQPSPSPLLREIVARDCGQLAHRRHRAMIVLGVVALVVALGLGGGLGVRSTAMLGAWFWIALVLYVLGGLVLFALAFGLSLPAGRRLRPVVVASGVGALALIASFIVPGAAAGTGERFVSMGLRCTGTGVATALAIMLAALYCGRGVLRRHAPTGLLLGLGAGLLGLVPLHLHCPANAASHLILWHGLVPILAAMIVGLGWGLLRER